MMDRIRWICHEVRWFVIRVLHVITGKYYINAAKYGGHELHKAEEGNTLIQEKLISGEPFAYCRYSYTEMEIMVRTITESLLGIHSTARIDWLGIFAPDENDKYHAGKRYTDLMGDAFKEADIIGIWDNLCMGDGLLEYIGSNDGVYITHARSVEAFYFDNPWTRGLEGKKVLVVSPFSKEIKEQYLRKDLIWDDKNVLPDFVLDTEDAVWYYAGMKDARFHDWFEAYEYLFNRIMSHDFDVVILSCGYFGFPLAARIKQAGKQAIHMGGATQILFGIKGSRWDNNPDIKTFYNENWIRPKPATKPEDDRNLDDGCYW